MFVLKNEYGANTTLVNGKFNRIKDDGVQKFTRYFAPQEYMKMGYGFNHPFITVRIIIGKFIHTIAARHAVINPTPD